MSHTNEFFWRLSEKKSGCVHKFEVMDALLYLLEQEYAGLNDDEIQQVLECYLNLPEIPHPDCNPLNYAHISKRQQ
jgi:hypothetical protein